MFQTGVAHSGGEWFSLTLPNTPAGAVRARKALIHFVRQFGLADDIVDDIQTVLGEALANAAEHGRRPRGTIRVRAQVRDGVFAATISDDGPGFPAHPDLPEVPPPLAPRGYGLFLMRTLVDELEFADGGQTVHLRKRISEVKTAHG